MSNGKEAIAITDAQGSSSGRKSDSFVKLFPVNFSGYFGVLYGTGDANIFLGSTFGHDVASLDAYVRSLYSRMKALVDTIDTNYMTRQREEITKEALVISDDGRRADFARQQELGFIQRYEQAKQNQTWLVTVGFDREAGRVRCYLVRETGSLEIFTPHLEVGSGADGANFSLGTAIQGLDVTRLPAEGLLYFAVNAYHMATENVGVGGTPKIAAISGNGVMQLPDANVRALMNLSGAFLSRYSVITPGSMIGHCKGALEGMVNLRAISRVTGLSGEQLVRMSVPYNVWQDMANQKLFWNGK